MNLVPSWWHQSPVVNLESAPLHQSSSRLNRNLFIHPHPASIPIPTPPTKSTPSPESAEPTSNTSHHVHQITVKTNFINGQPDRGVHTPAPGTQQCQHPGLNFRFTTRPSSANQEIPDDIPLSWYGEDLTRHGDRGSLGSDALRCAQDPLPETERDIHAGLWRVGRRGSVGKVVILFDGSWLVRSLDVGGVMSDEYEVGGITSRPARVRYVGSWKAVCDRRRDSMVNRTAVYC